MYKFHYHEQIMPFDGKCIILKDTEATWESETLADKDAMVQYFNTLKRVYEKNGMFVSPNVNRPDIVAFGVRIDDLNSPYFGGCFSKVLKIEEV